MLAFVTRGARTSQLRLTIPDTRLELLTMEVTGGHLPNRESQRGASWRLAAVLEWYSPSPQRSARITVYRDTRRIVSTLSYEVGDNSGDFAECGKPSPARRRWISFCFSVGQRPAGDPDRAVFGAHALFGYGMRSPGVSAVRGPGNGRTGSGRHDLAGQQRLSDALCAGSRALAAGSRESTGSGTTQPLVRCAPASIVPAFWTRGRTRADRPLPVVRRVKAAITRSNP
jgi:hypothetical protein